MVAVGASGARARATRERVDAADDLSWCVLHYSGAAARAAPPDADADERADFNILHWLGDVESACAGVCKQLHETDDDGNARLRKTRTVKVLSSFIELGLIQRISPKHSGNSKHIRIK